MNKIIELKEALRWLLQLHRRASSLVRVLKYVPGVKCQIKYLGAARPEGASLPVPPQNLWLGYGANEVEYIESGRRDVEKMKFQLEEAGFRAVKGMKILDLGCGGGRMIRHWIEEATDSSIWGCDISADHIYWLKGHLSPPFHFFLNTTIPHLPFADRMLDMVYAGSVFTHIDDFAEAWLMEVARVLKPGGMAWISIHDEEAVKKLLNPASEHPLSRLIEGLVDEAGLRKNRVVCIGEDADSQVFYASAYMREWMEGSFEIRAVVPGGYGYQTVYVLRKRSEPS